MKQVVVTTNDKGQEVEAPDPMSNEFIVKEYIREMKINIDAENHEWSYKKFEMQKSSLLTLSLSNKVHTTSDILILRDDSELIIENNSALDNFEVKSVNMGLNTKLKMILPEEGEFVCERDAKGKLLFTQKIYGPITNFRESALVKMIFDSVKYYEDSLLENNVEILDTSCVMTFVNDKQYKLAKLNVAEGQVVTIDGIGEVEVSELNLAKNAVINIKNPNFTFAKKFLINQEISSVIELTLPNKSPCAFTKTSLTGHNYTQDKNGPEKQEIYLSSDLKQAIINPNFIKEERGKVKEEFFNVCKDESVIIQQDVNKSLMGDNSSSIDQIDSSDTVGN